MILLNKQSQTNTNNLLDTVECFRFDVNRKVNPNTRSELGQFMTNIQVGKFMASLFNDITGEIKLVDAGAAIGSLTATFIEEACNRKTKPRTINSTCYEIDNLFVDYLRDTLYKSNALCLKKKIKFNSNVKRDDFIEAGCDLVLKNKSNTSKSALYTHAILNPPYKKILSSSKHRKWLREIGVETSNLYTGFLAIIIKLLEPKGEFVAIIPRGFCNGPYFKPFRDLLFSETALTKIHVFDSRTKAFKDDEVLQENIIIHAVKGGKQEKISISSSSGHDFDDMTQRFVPFENVVKPDDPEKFIHINTSEFDQHIVDRISVFNYPLQSLGIEVSTGPVVDFRLKKDLCKKAEHGTAPLLYPLHFEANKVAWPKDGKKPNAIKVTTDTKKWLWPNSDYYVVTRRFTAKEEKKRIVASIYDSSLPGSLIGFENHLNVFHKGKEGIPKAVAKGLAVYLNCTLLDKYFRQFNGHTQVNSTDLRTIRYPSIKILKKWGTHIKGTFPNQEDIDLLINKEIKSMTNKTTFDPIQAQKKIDEALEILKNLGLPKGQHNERSALTLLAILNLKPDGIWQKLEKPLMGITPIMEFCRDFYHKEYAPNTRETFRRQTMHQFVDACISLYNPDKPERPVNSPKACYQISPDAFEVIKTFNTQSWENTLKMFLSKKDTLSQKYAMKRDMEMIPVEVIKGTEIKLSPGSHSKLIKDIIEEFAPRYAPGAKVIYVGDTENKTGYFDKNKLKELGVEINKYGKMPDVVLFYPEKNWILLIESVTSHGPVDGKRHGELSKLFKKSKAGLVYVTAFPDRGTMSKYLNDISWETEVWVADAPTHLIHFNGERFLGPYKD